MRSEYDEKSVFVTGAAYGTGFAIAKKFAMEGYNVFVSGRDGEKLMLLLKSFLKNMGFMQKAM